MAGLLSDVLPSILGYGNKARKRVGGLLSDPRNGLAGLLNDAAGDFNEQMRAPNLDQAIMGQRSFYDPAVMGDTNKLAGALLGMVKPTKLGYQIEHKPMAEAGGAARLHDLLPAFGEDVYTPKAMQFFGSGDARERAALRIMQSLRGKPDAPVTIYRGVPAEAKGINPGDWVTLSKEAAEDYASQHPGGRVIALQVPASHVTSWADSLLEFGYFPK